MRSAIASLFALVTLGGTAAEGQVCEVNYGYPWRWAGVNIVIGATFSHYWTANNRFYNYCPEFANADPWDGYARGFPAWLDYDPYQGGAGHYSYVSYYSEPFTECGWHVPAGGNVSEILINMAATCPGDKGLALAHELGHAMGLSNSPQVPSCANRLMYGTTGGIFSGPHPLECRAWDRLWCTPQEAIYLNCGEPPY